ncbi:putative TMPIT-like protein [Monocercomonoides exilis]|uniref:putative TMPIT-like protein n=1 Tax=Monocercomonoides exilis TaxID=2049356 RepID=UPI003559410F|nr:putative TMPIT-like protein [Monocercomonoides exilis]|eukprot:MONOS_7526.1-p1 / transcript=MONOS_7526.1 / gene=MONOS_7526 / organism=Monocercomonoides_exilis_PA203 / gene_product=Transmembrane protein 120 homolog / transcript_product=Transmembrane protein 120 homolog / location=Mono_scaffold00259:33739-35063(-) / protein_length=422 / sequence_SO=supercontig / SO=protein_coding / is_pseudo=false
MSGVKPSKDFVEMHYKALLEEQEECEKELVHYRQVLKEYHQLQESIDQKCQKHRKQLEATKKLIKNSDMLESEKAEKLNAISELKTVSNSWRSLFPCESKGFLAYFIGTANVRMLKPSERLNYKMEYNVFRQNYSYIFIFFNFVLGFLFNYHLLDILWFGWNVTFYLAVSLRERILRVNGSHIRGWWKIHHMCCLFFCCGLVAWFDSPQYQEMRQSLYAVGVYTGVVQFLQAKYQMSRLYTLVSLGKVSEMDVPNRDSTPLHWSINMTLLLPFLLFGYFLQFYLGFKMCMLYITRQAYKEWNLIFIGAIFIFLSIGNTFATTITFVKSHGGKKVNYAIEWTSQFLYGGSGITERLTPSPISSPGLNHHHSRTPSSASSSSIPPSSSSSSSSDFVTSLIPHHSSQLSSQESSRGIKIDSKKKN